MELLTIGVGVVISIGAFILGVLYGRKEHRAFLDRLNKAKVEEVAAKAVDDLKRIFVKKIG